MNRSLVSSLMDNGRRGLGAGYTMKHIEEELVTRKSFLKLSRFYIFILSNIYNLKMTIHFGRDENMGAITLMYISKKTK
jgi:hypothetical protein